MPFWTCNAHNLRHVMECPMESGSLGPKGMHKFIPCQMFAQGLLIRFTKQLSCQIYTHRKSVKEFHKLRGIFFKKGNYFLKVTPLGYMLIYSLRLHNEIIRFLFEVRRLKTLQTLLLLEQDKRSSQNLKWPLFIRLLHSYC